MTREELDKVLKEHGIWLKDNTKGKRANLRDANLEGANLGDANLNGANLNGANLDGAYLRWADLEGVDLRGADLCGADLRWADLSGADLRWADLRGANLRWADLTGANLEGANLRDANLSDADIRGANLRGADLRDANLNGADLRRADLTNTKLPDFQLVPEKGSFTAYKKVSNNIVLELQIPEEAKRTSSLIGNKCRAEYVKISGAYDKDKNKLPDDTVLKSRHNTKFTYKIGELSHPDKYDDDIRVECTNGIHFFMTFEEAAKY